MRQVTVTFVALLLTSATLLGCGGSQSPAEAPAEPTPAEVPTDGATEPQGPARPELTVEECEGKGGTVVGDIGDGAIHKPDYRCPSGVEPLGDIRAAEGGPMGVEGSVCCPK